MTQLRATQIPGTGGLSRLPVPGISDARPRVDPLTWIVAASVLVLLPLRVTIVNGVSVGLVAALVIAPLWLGKLRGYSGGVAWVTTLIACIGSGLWLTALASSDHVIALHQIRMWVGLLMTLAVTIGVVLWARTFMRDGTVAVLYGTGMLVSSVVVGFAASNPWKGGYSLPLTVVLLGLAWLWRRRSLEIGFGLGLAAVSAANDSRSHFAIVLLAVALVVWQVLVRGAVRTRARSAWGSLLALTAIGVAVYSLGQALILEGYLGEDTRARSEAQIETSGSILLGGRPELGATAALMAFRPWGFGFGTLPTVEEIRVAKSGMATLNYDPENGYVENYMFGEVVKLHSIVGDSWALFGFAGVLLVALLVWTLLRRLALDLSTGTLTALTAFLAARLIWDLAFGGLYASLTILGIAVGLALLPQRRLARDRNPGRGGAVQAHVMS